MSQLCRAVVKMPHEGGLERDVTQNTFWFITDVAETNAADLVVAPDIVAALFAFYNATTPSISNFLASYLVRADVTTELSMVDPTTGLQQGDTAVFDMATFDAPGSTNNLPAEVALCLSYASSNPVVPVRRRRGRIYLGGFITGASAPDAYARPDSDVVTAMLLSAVNLATDQDGFTWAIYSRAAGAALSVDNGWVDNEWDTQRRRGQQATSRELWNI